MTGTPGNSGVEERLDRILHLLTAIVTKGMSRKDAVMTLTAAGLAPKDVAGMLALTINQVSVALYDAKQASAKAAKSPKPSVGKT